MNTAEAKAMGFKIMIFPGATIEPIIDAVNDELKVLKETGSTSTKKWQGGVHAAFNACGLAECVEIDKKAGGKAYATVNDKAGESGGTNGTNGH